MEDDQMMAHLLIIFFGAPFLTNKRMVHLDGGRQSFGAPGFEFHSFQFFQKCLLFDLTLTSFPAEIENKILLPGTTG